MNKRKVFGILVVVMIAVFATAAVIIAASSATNKTALFSRHQPGGLFALVNESDGVGNIWFVDSGSATGADAAGYGRNPDAPYLTIDYAIGNCTASNGDRIFVAPGHAENVSTAAYIDADAAGVRIIGQGVGRNRPVLTWTAAVGEIKVNAADVSFENLVFNMELTGGVFGGTTLYSTATDTVFKDCDFVIPSVDTVMVLTGGTRTQINNCRFYGSTGSGTGVTTAVIAIGSGVYNVEIKDTSIIAYNTTQDTALIAASTSRVSGFTLQDSSIIQGNSGASCWNFSTVGLVSEGLIKNVATTVGNEGTGGTSSYQLHTILRLPPYNANE